MNGPDDPMDRDDRRDDPRSDLRQEVESRADEAKRAAERAGGGASESIGSTDGPNGSGGEVKNQDDMAQ